jgi:hypothetical protein
MNHPPQKPPEEPPGEPLRQPEPRARLYEKQRRGSEAKVRALIVIGVVVLFVIIAALVWIP